MRVFAWLIAAVTMIVALAAIAALFAIGNPAASAWIVRQSVALAPGKIVIHDISGDLVSGIRLGSVHYELPSVQITAQNAAIRFGWLELIEGRLVFYRLVATELEVGLIEDDTSADGAALPEIRTPIGIHVNHLRLGRLSIRTGDFDQSLTEVTAQLRFDDARLDVKSFRSHRDDLRLSLSGWLDFVDAYPLMARVNWHMADGQLEGSGQFSGDLRAVDFDHVLQVPDPVSVSGQFTDLTGQPRIEATAKWSNVTWSSEQGEIITSGGGQARFEGITKRFTAQLQGGLSLPSVSGLQIDVEAAGDLQQIEITRLAIAGFGGSLSGSGWLSVGDQHVVLQLTGTDLDPGTFRPNLPGRLDANAVLDFRFPNHLDIDIQSVRGEFLGQRLNGKARIASTGEQWSVTDMQLNAADNRLRLDGMLLPSLSARFRIDANDLSAVWPDLRGKVKGRGEVEGSLAKPVAQIKLQAGQLFYRDHGVENLDIDGNIDSSQRIRMTIGAQGLSTGGALLGDLDARASGTLGAQLIQIDLTGGAVDVSISAAGGWNGQAARFSIDAGTIDSAIAGRWQLANTFDLQATAAGLRFGAHCWTQEPARLCAQDAEFGDTTTRISGTLTRLPLVGVQQWLGEDFTVHGTADAEFALLRVANKPFEGRLRWRQRSTQIAYRDSPKSMVSMTIDSVDFDITAGRERTDVTGKIRTNFGIAVDVAAQTTPLVDRDASIDGRVKIMAPDIAETVPLLNRFVDIDRAGGRLNANLTISGTIGAPRIQGDARLADGSVYIRQTGIDIEDIQLLFSGRDDSPIQVTGSARSGTGELRVNGQLDYSDHTGAFVDLSIDGENFQIIRLPDQTADVSPKLTAHIDERQIALTGTVLIPRAEIVVESLPEAAAVPSADAVVETTTTQKSRRSAPIEFVGEIDLVLGDNVRFAGFGIDTRLAGGLKLSRNMGAVSAVTEGNLRTVDGRFDAYRKKLQIERGALIFVGSLTDPNLDVRAVRKLTYEGQPVTVGVLLTGRLSAIQTRIFSEPAMSEADALSYLVLDRPLRQAEDSDSADLSSAALALGISQALPVTQRLGENLGLDEVSIEGTSEETTALVAGRRLGEDVYIRYSYGLFNRIGTFIIRYDLRGGISVEAGSGEEQTLDLVFTIRR